MKCAYSLLLIAGVILLLQCKRSVTGKGDVVTEDRVTSSFQHVSLEGAGTIIIMNGPQNKVQIRGYENLVPLVKTHVKNDELIISMKDDFALNNSNIEITVTAPVINEASLNGAGDLELRSFKGSRLKISLSGAGNVRFSESAFDTVIATLSGAGNMFVNANTYLAATVNGVGTIEYAGDPEVKSTINGLGNVSKK